jgi:hypothetical protein
MSGTLRELDASTLVRLWTKITAGIVGYGFGVEYGKLERPRLGIFDGLKITLDPEVDFEMQVFLMLHLFGHSVQWTAPSYRPEVLDVSQEDLEPFLDAVSRYEHNAARFGLQLLHEIGVYDIDPWMYDFAATDARYLETFYRTGSIPTWENCIVRGAAPFEPLSIPALEHRRVDVQFAF